MKLFSVNSMFLISHFPEQTSEQVGLHPEHTTLQSYTSDLLVDLVNDALISLDKKYFYISTGFDTRIYSRDSAECSLLWIYFSPLFTTSENWEEFFRLTSI